MAQLDMHQQAYRITRFVTVQLIALIGWIIVQSFFSFTLFGQTIPVPVTIVIEAIWWIATLVLMFWLFKRVYNRFTQAVFELEEANQRLRQRTNSVLFELKNQGNQEEQISKPD